jgi:hypothetical protein
MDAGMSAGVVIRASFGAGGKIRYGHLEIDLQKADQS